MKFKKNALALAVTSAALSSVAIAGSWVPTGTGTAVEYATELFGASNTTTLTARTASYELAASLAGSTSQRVDITLTNATFGTAPTLTFNAVADTFTSDSGTDGLLDVGDTNVDSTGAATATLVAGGGTTDSTAQFRVSTNATTTGSSPGTATGGTNGDTFTLAYTMANVTGLGTPTTTGGPTLAFSISDGLGNVDTAGTAGVTSAAAKAITVSVATGTADNIDVTTGSTLFETTTNSFDLGGFTLTDDTSAVDTDSATEFEVNASSGALTDLTVTINGDLAAAVAVDADSDTTTNDGVVLAGCGLTANATTLTATQAIFSITSANAATITDNTECTLTMAIDGTTPLTVNQPTLTVALDYSTAGIADDTVTGNLTNMVKNGSFQLVPLLLNPDGAYDNFIRITNGGSVAGSVFVTLTNDAGDSVLYTLPGGTLAAGTSTDLISVATMYSDAQAADATFDVGTGKLRARVEGEFSGINVQNISVSTDGTTFFTF